MKKDLIGAAIGGVLGAVLARELSCVVTETECGLQFEALAFGALIGGLIGAGIGSGF